MEELKPCPFCGGKASVKDYLKGKYAVSCDTGGCLASLFPYDTIEEAIAAWNRRATNGGITIKKEYHQQAREVYNIGHIDRLDL